ncbi:hypothetical protein SO802_025953 [Lithocarpus litseifolius]|uniref:RRM domain-containing protein n=1 Tax=Lithocarpus litseifolius TaxID=425828 RepID=A0AAW2BZ61_9ROSI
MTSMGVFMVFYGQVKRSQAETDQKVFLSSLNLSGWLEIQGHIGNFGGQEDQGKLFTGGISWETTEEKLKEYFENYGDVVQTVVMRDKTIGRPRLWLCCLCRSFHSR